MARSRMSEEERITVWFAAHARDDRGDVVFNIVKGIMRQPAPKLARKVARRTETRLDEVTV